VRPGVPGAYAAGSSSRIGCQRATRMGAAGSTTSSRARALNSCVCALAECSSRASLDAQTSYPSTRVSSSGSSPTSKRTTPRSSWCVAMTSRSRASRISRWAPGLVVNSTTSCTCGEAGSVMAVPSLNPLHYDGHHRAQPSAPVPEQGGSGRRGDRLAKGRGPARQRPDSPRPSRSGGLFEFRSRPSTRKGNWWRKSRDTGGRQGERAAPTGGTA
jgi:hypothetical protein